MKTFAWALGLSLAALCGDYSLSAEEAAESTEATGVDQGCHCAGSAAAEACHCPATIEDVCCGCSGCRLQSSGTLSIQMIVPRGTKLGPGNDATTRIQTADEMKKILGEKSIAEDGSIELGRFGKVQVGGFTIEEAREVIAWKLTEAGPFASVEVRLDEAQAKPPTAFELFASEAELAGWMPRPICDCELKSDTEGPWDFVTALESHAVSDQPEAVESAESQITQVSYKIDVFEDRTNCMAEFAPFRDGQPVMFAESGTMLPALSVLRKHDLIRTMSAPRLICTTGQTATADFGVETSPGEAESWEGVKLELSAQEREKGLQIEFSIDATQDRVHNKVETSVNIPAGQTVVLSTTGPQIENESGEVARRPIYVVLTPEIVK